MAFAAARMILKDKRRKSKEEFSAPARNRSKVLLYPLIFHLHVFIAQIMFGVNFGVNLK